MLKRPAFTEIFTLPPNEGECRLNIYEAAGIGYVLLATTIFTVAVVYFAITGLKHVHRLVMRGQAEENLDLRRTESIKRELANVE
jgi:hypothetical protein